MYIQKLVSEKIAHTARDLLENDYIVANESANLHRHASQRRPNGAHVHMPRFNSLLAVFLCGAVQALRQGRRLLGK